MTDQTDPLDADADDFASDFDQTDEQLWEEIDAKDPDTQGQGDEDEAADDFADPSEDGQDDQPGPKGSGDDPQALRAQNSRLENQLKSQNGRVAAKDREIAALKDRIAKAETSLQQREQAAKKADARAAKIAATREEYPDVVGPLAEELDDLKAERKANLARDRAAVNADKAKLAEFHAEQEATFLKEHTDGFDLLIANRDTFDEWIEDQPRKLRETFKANKDTITDGLAAAHLVGLFKAHLHASGKGRTPARTNPSDKLAAKREAQLDGARANRSTQATRTRPLPSEGGSEQDDWDYFDRLEARSRRR